MGNGRISWPDPCEGLPCLESLFDPAPCQTMTPCDGSRRLNRAISENDFPLAAIARERLYDLGWAVAHLPTEAPTPGQADSDRKGVA